MMGFKYITKRFPVQKNPNYSNEIWNRNIEKERKFHVMYVNILK